MAFDELRIVVQLDRAGNRDSVTVLKWLGHPGEYSGFPPEVTVCQGRSFGDVLKAISEFFGVEVAVKE